MNEKAWFSARELAGMPGLPATERWVRGKADREAWQSRDRQGRGGGREYHLDSLPKETRIHLAAQVASAKVVKLSEKRTRSAEEQLIETIKSEAETMASEEQRRRDAILQARVEGRRKFDLLPDWQKERAEAKLEILTACYEFIKTTGLGKIEGQEIFCAEVATGSIALSENARKILRGKTLHPATIRRWTQLELDGGIYALVDHYGVRRGTGAIDTNPQVQSAILAIIEKVPHIKSGHMLRALRARFGPEVDVCERTVGRWMDRWIEENKSEYVMMTNPDKWRNTCMMAIGKADAGIDAPNDLWEFDSSPADLMFENGRYCLIGVVDVYTRRLMFQVAKSSRSVGIAALVRRALIAWGVPRKVKTDNGQDYRSKMLTRIWADLAVEREFCPPFTPDHKPFIERGFGTFSHDLVEDKSNFIGHNVAERKDIEARVSFAKRLKTPGDLIPMTGKGEDFQTFCDDWCTGGSYGRKYRSELGCSPLEAAENSPIEVRRIQDPNVLDYLVMEDAGTRQITKKGVSVGNLWFVDLHGVMGAHVQQTVYVMKDTMNPSRIVLFRFNDAGIKEFLCEAWESEGIDLAKAAAIQKAEQKKLQREQREERKQRNKDWKNVDVGQMILDVERAAAAKIISFPRPGVPYSTPTLEAFAAAAEEVAANGPLTPERIEAINQADPVKPETERKLAEVISLEQRRAEKDPVTVSWERFHRWRVMAEVDFQGLTPEDNAWRQSYELSDEFHARKMEWEYMQEQAQNGK